MEWIGVLSVIVLVWSVYLKWNSTTTRTNKRGTCLKNALYNILACKRLQNSRVLQ